MTNKLLAEHGHLLSVRQQAKLGLLPDYLTPTDIVELYDAYIDAKPALLAAINSAISSGALTAEYQTPDVDLEFRDGRMSGLKFTAREHRVHRVTFLMWLDGQGCRPAPGDLLIAWWPELESSQVRKLTDASENRKSTIRDKQAEKKEAWAPLIDALRRSRGYPLRLNGLAKALLGSKSGKELAEGIEKKCPAYRISVSTLCKADRSWRSISPK